MLEALVVATATTGLFALAMGIRGNERFRAEPAPRGDRGDDLPCPWCYGPTDETDRRCRGCGRHFG
ncbi:MAG: hypothetical protein L0Z49_00645 [Actinobacteria bacterium]|nr:hypothetical protein [Actinomycetota bacterium]MCI0542936.1 hypothetical protein [Actinomycetota bacterium]MCI0677475.1 hypothetical protein [Actinomycetota bacterium]